MDQPDRRPASYVHGDVMATADAAGAKHGATLIFDPYGQALSSLQGRNRFGRFAPKGTARGAMKRTIVRTVRGTRQASIGSASAGRSHGCSRRRPSRRWRYAC